MLTRLSRRGTLLATLVVITGSGWICAWQQHPGAIPYVPSPPAIDLIFPGYFSEVPVTSVGGVPDRLVPGQLTDDALLDVVVHNGSAAGLLYGADVFANSWSITSPVTDVVAYTPETGSVDCLIVATATGLESWTYRPDGTVASTSLGSGAWIGAHSLQVGDFDGTGSTDLAGVSAAGDVIVLHDVESDPAGTELVFPVLTGAIELALVDLDDDGLDEIAVRTSAAGMCLYDSSGAFILKVRGYHPHGALTAIRKSGPDGLAWIALDMAGTNEALLVWDGFVLHTVPMGIPATSAIAAGDIDGDGAADLALRRGSAGDLLILLHDGVSYDPNDPDFAQLIPGVTGDGATGIPLFVDLDRDGDTDLLWGANGGSRLRSIRSGAIEEINQAPNVGVVFDQDDPLSPSYLLIHLANGTSVPANATHLQVSLFRKHAISAATDSEAYASLLLPFTPDASAPTPPPPTPPTQVPGNPTSFPNPGGGGSPPSPYPSWTVPLVETTEEFPAIYAIVVRYVEAVTVGSETVVVESGPARVLLFTSQDQVHQGSGGPLDYILSQVATVLWYGTAPNEVLPPGFEGELSSTGTVIETKPIPDLPDDEKPDFLSTSQSP
ncbi:MAG: FG-GAP repeat domain-containing protein [Planctomycetota bacterium]